jgi:hypothetical protein
VPDDEAVPLVPPHVPRQEVIGQHRR